jgi:hypothetical protein
MSDQQTPYEAPSVEEIMDEGLPLDASPHVTPISPAE